MGYPLYAHPKHRALAVGTFNPCANKGQGCLEGRGKDAKMLQTGHKLKVAAPVQSITSK